MSLLTLGILAVVAIIITIFGFIFKDEGWKILFLILGFVGLVIVGAFGFGYHASSNCDTMVVEQLKPDTVLKSRTTVYVEIDGQRLYFTEKVDFDEIDNDAIFYKVIYYNYYGFETYTIYSRNKIFKNIECGKLVEPIKEK
ncbi:MAG: hypothetical protein HPY57_13860 [Ignavibacteria bacterium]|nr:hypothetical protein [Ignavibacteria bacterium]